MTPVSSRATSTLTAATWRRWTLVLAAATCVAGSVYAFVTPAGLPYDEPSHWATVQYYADHERMPVLGDAGVTYEAQMGPVAYVADAVIVRLADALGLSAETGFRLVRLFGVLQLAALVLVLGALTARVVSVSPASLAALAIIALNPMLLTMSASVQNDSLALLLGVAVMTLALTRLGERPTPGWAVSSVASREWRSLTKLTNWVVVGAVAGWLVWAHRRRALEPVLGVSWSSGRRLRVVVRPQRRLYGDPTSASAVERSGVSFDRYRLESPGDIGHIVQQIVTYLWLPTEYLRNFIGAPAMLKAALLILTVAVALLGGVRLGRIDRSALLLVGGAAAVSAATWLITYLAYQSVAPRVTYLALPLWVGLLALAGTRLPSRTVVAAAIALITALNAWCIVEIGSLSAPTFLEFG